MGQTRPPKPVMLILAVTSSHEDAFHWAAERASQVWGPVWHSGPRFAFDQTSFYQKTMGPSLQKQLLAFASLIDPAQLADIKLQSNQWESDYADSHPSPEARPINLDPGYVTEAKLVLGTVKNRDHRVYLREGIYAEVTLSYWDKQWNGHRWTYPDYLLQSNLDFLTDCRDELRRRLHQEDRGDLPV